MIFTWEESSPEVNRLLSNSNCGKASFISDGLEANALQKETIKNQAHKHKKHKLFFIVPIFL